MILLDDWLPQTYKLDRKDIEIRPLHREDYVRVPIYTARWLPREVFERTVFSAHGYASFLQQNAGVPLRCQNDRFHGFYQSGQLQGFSEWKLRGTTVVLNNFFLNDAIRCLGVGSTYLQEMLLHFSKSGISHVSLDVFTWNQGARRFYERLGFDSEHISGWYELELEDAASFEVDSYDYNGIRMMNWAEAKAMNQCYGLGSFTLQGAFGEEAVGLLKDQYYRLRGEALRVKQVVLALQQLGEERKVLITDGNPHCTSTAMKLVNESLRMRRTLTSAN
ncbi:GNAT family N-acetyltransferase [Paenibacillus sp. GCM10027629]|uniref:GNAT family N-acetyltransferase n=1 Tax=Paenibacillus sp. GCM10027629 TaxID=3273414 RepID=UPI003625EC06